VVGEGPNEVLVYLVGSCVQLLELFVNVSNLAAFIIVDKELIPTSLVRSSDKYVFVLHSCLAGLDPELQLKVLSIQIKIFGSLGSLLSLLQPAKLTYCWNRSFSVFGSS
jgi:hypothetical protein